MVSDAVLYMSRREFNRMDYFNTNIIRNHDDIMMLNAWQVDFFNMMLGLVWLNDSERDMYEEEMKSYLCYDV
jgi:hypothetical protein